MPDLPRGTLRCFPVAYPLHCRATGIAPSETKTLGDHVCDREIRFNNSFRIDRNQGRDIHGAIDIFGAFGLIIKATCPGTIVEKWRSGRKSVPGVGRSSEGDGGFYVMIRDGAGFYHYYSHMQNTRTTLALREGDAVAAGQVVGYLGDSGRARGTCQHLHYQVTTRNEIGALHQIWNPFNELVRLALPFGISVHGIHVRLPVTRPQP